MASIVHLHDVQIFASHQRGGWQIGNVSRDRVDGRQHDRCQTSLLHESTPVGIGVAGRILGWRLSDVARMSLVCATVLSLTRLFRTGSRSVGVSKCARTSILTRYERWRRQIRRWWQRGG